MSEANQDVRLDRNRSGYYEIRWTERAANGRARTRSYSLRTRDRAEADAKVLAWVAARNMVASKPTDLTIAALIDEYTRLYLDPNNKPDSQRWALRPIKKLLGNDTLLSLDRHRIAWYRAERRNAGRADATIRRELGALVAVLNWCVKHGVLPAETRLPAIDLPPEAMPRETYLSRREEQRMWDLASSAVLNDAKRRWRIGLFICLALETAARTRAIERLEWDRVDLANGLIDYRDRTVQVSKKRRVPVPISNRLMPVLQHAQAKAKTKWVLGHPGSTLKAFTTFCRDEGFDITRHDLRRTWATLAAQDGVDLFHIAGMLGDTIEVTMRHYAHHSPNHLRSAVNRKRRAA